ncbi:MAG: energy transducer TonB [Duncaniella sp.]|uniref:energy transducer TonB n=1 Tax=Duncaniella sp. TaxID=2518496 RepID=UPI0023C52B63|nr:energy transducer TonB [Duncaniella sp.]MDE5988399.1 energy transducer TonB [Duncaniella sp.]MDE6174970.1 energy transducer TonB [Duncaniella sp.]
MPKTLLRSILLYPLLAGAAVHSAAQQPRHIANVSRARVEPVCVDVYEYDCVDVHPQFPGGDGAMVRFINKERRYPSQAYREGIEGRVLCSFVVNEDGSISHISVIRGVEKSLDREAVRIISNMPKWNAGVLSDSLVPVYYILPISFRI